MIALLKDKFHSNLIRTAIVLKEILTYAQILVVHIAEVCEDLPRFCARDLARVICPLMKYIVTVQRAHGTAILTIHNPNSLSQHNSLGKVLSILVRRVISNSLVTLHGYLAQFIVFWYCSYHIFKSSRSKTCSEEI